MRNPGRVGLHPEQQRAVSYTILGANERPEQLARGTSPAHDRIAERECGDLLETLTPASQRFREEHQDAFPRWMWGALYSGRQLARFPSRARMRKQSFGEPALDGAKAYSMPAGTRGSTTFTGGGGAAGTLTTGAGWRLAGGGRSWVRSPS